MVTALTSLLVGRQAVIARQGLEKRNHQTPTAREALRLGILEDPWAMFCSGVASALLRAVS